MRRSQVVRQLGFAVMLMAVGFVGCRRIHPLQEVHSATAPHISRVFLANGKVIQFDEDLGWLNVQDSNIDGTTIDSQHVRIALKEVRSVETVREYSVVFLYAAALAAMGVAAYLLFRLFELV